MSKIDCSIIFPLLNESENIEFSYNNKTGCKNSKKPSFYSQFYYSISKFSEQKRSSSKNSIRGILKPLASIIKVLKVTVLFRPFIIHCILPCCIPDSCSRRYWVIPFSRNNLEIRFATASFTVKLIPSDKKIWLP